MPWFKGKGRLQRFIARALQCNAGSNPILEEINGVRWSLDAKDVIQFRLLWDGYHDPHVVKWLVRQLSDGAPRTLWDIGANVGAVSLCVAAEVPGLSVESFEPSPGPRAQLIVNASLNPSLGVRVHDVALADRSGTASFYESAEASNGGLGTLYLASNTSNIATDVNVERGDTLIVLERATVPDVIKIDVEGFELEVLDGLSQTLALHRPRLCVESAGYRLAERGLAPDSILQKLKAFGYRVMAIDPAGDELPLDSVDLGDNLDLAAHPLSL